VCARPPAHAQDLLDEPSLSLRNPAICFHVIGTSPGSASRKRPRRPVASGPRSCGIVESPLQSVAASTAANSVEDFVPSPESGPACDFLECHAWRHLVSRPPFTRQASPYELTLTWALQSVQRGCDSGNQRWPAAALPSGDPVNSDSSDAPGRLSGIRFVPATGGRWRIHGIILRAQDRRDHLVRCRTTCAYGQLASSGDSITFRVIPRPWPSGTSIADSTSAAHQLSAWANDEFGHVTRGPPPCGSRHRPRPWCPTVAGQCCVTPAGVPLEEI